MNHSILSPSPPPSQLSLPWRRALVIGAGVSGQAAVNLLLYAGIEVGLYDCRSHPELDFALQNQVSKTKLRTYFGAAHPPDEAFTEIDLLVLSPGVDPRPILMQKNRLAKQAFVAGEMSLGLSVAIQLWPDVESVFVTGTNGKSTVVSLTGSLLAAGGYQPFVGGNLGTPLTSMILEVLQGARSRPDSLVLECSSYQLETFHHHACKVAILTNISPDHLDRYHSLAEYAATKQRIFAGLQNDGIVILDAKDEWTSYIGAHVPKNSLVRIDGESLEEARILGEGPGHTLVLANGEEYERSSLQLMGRHNSKNALFALTAARHWGVPAEACKQGLSQFRGLPHRMEFVGEIAGVRYYNDSKATNVASVLASLGGLTQKIVLIAGGRAKGDSLEPLRALLREKGRGLVAIGESAPAFLQLAEGLIPSVQAKDMEEAVRLAQKLAQQGDIVVLSPACASFDWYRNYGHRGETFASAVKALG